MKKPPIYMAIATRDGGFTVGQVSLYSVRPLGDVRRFATFDEADDAAQFIADGQGNYNKGIYVSNR